MKLIVHIGTHKTGTTALQQFLHANRTPLAARGIHYATPRGVPHSNIIANALNSGDSRLVHAFLTNQAQLARQREADAILVSAENFYAMSVLASMAERKTCNNAVERDQRLIASLGSLIPESITACQVVCYFRRPDRYAESLYSQHVKRGISFDGTFDDFLPIIRSALSYNTYIRSWCNVFGMEGCVVRTYESADGDIVGDFIRHVLDLNLTDAFSRSDAKGNERVGRDLLEYKRLINKTARFSERDIERAILQVIDETMNMRTAEPLCYQEFLPPHRRAGLLKLLQPELEALQRSFDMAPFPRFDLDTAMAKWRPYPGLDERRRREIEVHYHQINRRWRFRLERHALRAASLLRRRVPVTGVALDALKEVGAKRALHGFLGGMERRTG
jgi:hypothetical protein